MKNHTRIFLFSILLFFSSCSLTTETISLSYEKSNSALIKKSIQNLNASKTLSSIIDKSEKIAICSIEQSVTDDSGISSQIEDELIKEFVKDGYFVLERDNDMIGRLISESGGTYKLYNRIKKYDYENSGAASSSKVQSSSYGTSTSNLSGSSVNSGYSNLIGSGISGTANTSGTSSLRGKANSRSSSSMFGSSSQAAYQNKREVENFNQVYPTDLSSTDKIISYRIIECGITYSDIDEEDESFESEDYRRLVKRNARTILELRITESKTGRIIDAVSLDGKFSDEIRFDEFKKIGDFGYRNYHPSLPKVYGNPNLINDTKTNDLYTKSSSRRGAYIIGGMGLAIIGILVGAN